MVLRQRMSSGFCGQGAIIRVWSVTLPHRVACSWSAKRYNMWMGKVKAPEGMFFDSTELDFAKDGLIQAVRTLGLQVYK